MNIRTLCHKVWNMVLFNAILSAVAIGAAVQESLAVTLGDRASAIKDELGNFGGVVNIGLVLIGLVLFGSGFLGLRHAQKSQQPVGPHLLTIIIGVVLLSTGAIISMTSETLTGSDSSELDKIGI